MAWHIPFAKLGAYQELRAQYHFSTEVLIVRKGWYSDGFDWGIRNIGNWIEIGQDQYSKLLWGCQSAHLYFSNLILIVGANEWDLSGWDWLAVQPLAAVVEKVEFRKIQATLFVFLGERSCQSHSCQEAMTSKKCARSNVVRLSKLPVFDT